MGCRLSKALEWAIRAKHESLLHADNAFLTLTYSDSHLPAGGTLLKRDLQLFWKRVRKAKGPFRYLACGEYGEKTNRPHYHALIFGLDFDDSRPYGPRGQKYQRRVSRELEDLWGLGRTELGSVSLDSAGYVAKYATKKAMLGKAIDDHEDVDLATGEVLERTRPYLTMSRRPGIGHDFYNRYGHEIHRDDFIVVDGHKVRVPKYYDTLLERRNPERLLELQRRRTDEREEATYEQLVAQEEILKARLGLTTQREDL